jgi:tRNA pseudouridine38-40 synthase
MRIKAVISYDGSHFDGFQRQTSTPHTITTAIETALEDLNIKTHITGSGRTDAGVHATGQVIHLDVPEFWGDLPKLREHLNARLKHIRFKHISTASDDFHARFDAKKRTYRYVFSDKELSVFERPYVARVAYGDRAKLQEALGIFVGRHDFASFHKTGSETNSTIRTIYRARYKKLGKYNVIYLEADGFLRAQVRMIVCAALKVSNGELTLEQLEEQLTQAHRHTTCLAPPQGLYLSRVIYY